MVRIGKRKVGDGEPCFITFEAGPTHDGLASAKRLVALAAEAGADAVKFQMSDPDRLVADKSLMFKYSILINKKTGQTEEVSEPLYDILRRRYLSMQEWEELKCFADDLGLQLFFTVSFDDLIEKVVELDCTSIKIASADINHFPLLRVAARTGMCLQLDTGNATLGEIESAVDIIRSEGNEKIIIHNCPSGYPARLPSINLRLISTLKKMFPYPVGFSDHTPGCIMDVAAVSLGANLVEKTITEDRTTRSVEHMFSLEPDEMRQFVQTIRDLEIALGTTRRILSDAELNKRRSIRRSVYIGENVSAGRLLKDVRVEFKRPGYGISPDLYEQFLDMRVRYDLPKGHRLRLSDLEEQ